ncbi:MAG: hypothetical protein ACREP7_06135 [Lysobacter sp.]
MRADTGTASAISVDSSECPRNPGNSRTFFSKKNKSLRKILMRGSIRDDTELELALGMVSDTTISESMSDQLSAMIYAYEKKRTV